MGVFEMIVSFRGRARGVGFLSALSDLNVCYVQGLVTVLKSMVVMLMLTAMLPSLANDQTVENKKRVAETLVPLERSVNDLESIQQSIKAKREAVHDLSEKLKPLTDASEKLEAEQKIERIKKEISSLQASFEHIVLGGIDRSVFADQSDQQINWREELEQISKPLFSTLKELTDRPRQIDALRRDVDHQREQLKEIDKALGSLQSIKAQTVPPLVDGTIDQLLKDWQERRVDTQRMMDITQLKLANLKTESTKWQSSAWESVTEFLLGRGLTLLLAVVVAVMVWLVLKGLLALYWRWLYRSRRQAGVTRAPLLLYSYRLFTAIIIVLAVLMVFYARGDVLLITLALLALAGVALSLRQTLPRYAAELRLLLSIGPVREDERLIYEGIPYKVTSLSIYSLLRNPALEGFVRLPLHAMNEFASRQADDEPWFPCQPGDYVLFADGSLGKVLSQTIEMVHLFIRDTIVQMGTKSFLEQNVRNLSKQGFGIGVSFGVDYQHQSICLDKVPAFFREGILVRFEQAGLKDDVQDLLVEFKEAGASSLDYQIYMILKGSAAKAYFKAQRLIQQACVDTCNREGWVIPFTQVTVHSAHAEKAPERDACQATGVIVPGAVENPSNPQ
jgi:small-conductance mechanosensitive channel